MSIRQQITKAVLDKRTRVEVNLHGQIIELVLPEIGREASAGYNVRKKDQRLAKRAEQIADEQMAILATC